MLKLLTIDDETEFTALISNYFGARGFQVFTANRGEEGLAISEKESPDIHLIDLKMPGLHGDEVLREIIKKNSTAKVIMITASEGEGKTRAKLFELGASACFDKPISSLRDLESKIKEILQS